MRAARARAKEKRRERDEVSPFRSRFFQPYPPERAKAAANARATKGGEREREREREREDGKERERHPSSLILDKSPPSLSLVCFIVIHWHCAVERFEIRCAPALFPPVVTLTGTYTHSSLSLSLSTLPRTSPPLLSVHLHRAQAGRRPAARRRLKGRALPLTSRASSLAQAPPALLLLLLLRSQSASRLPRPVAPRFLSFFLSAFPASFPLKTGAVQRSAAPAPPPEPSRRACAPAGAHAAMLHANVQDHRETFRKDVVSWIAGAGFSQILFLTGSDANERIDAQLQG